MSANCSLLTIIITLGKKRQRTEITVSFVAPNLGQKFSSWKS